MATKTLSSKGVRGEFNSRTVTGHDARTRRQTDGRTDKLRSALH